MKKKVKKLACERVKYQHESRKVQFVISKLIENYNSMSFTTKFIHVGFQNTRHNERCCFQILQLD